MNVSSPDGVGVLWVGIAVNVSSPRVWWGGVSSVVDVGVVVVQRWNDRDCYGCSLVGDQEPWSPWVVGHQPWSPWVVLTVF